MSKKERTKKINDAISNIFGGVSMFMFGILCGLLLFICLDYYFSDEIYKSVVERAGACDDILEAISVYE